MTITDHDFELYVAARKIANMAYKYASPRRTWFKKPWIKDQRDIEVIPLYNQTAQGLFILEDCGRPGIIATPWGSWHCWGSASRNFPMERFLANFETTIHRELWNDNIGTHGPIHAVYCVDGIRLPDPIIRTCDKYIREWEAKVAWKQLTQRYMFNERR